MDVLVRTLPPGRPFLLFGLGDRPKFVFQDGALRRAPGGEPVHEWAHGAEAVLVPDAGRVELGGEPVVWEDEEGLFWRDGGAPVRVAGSGLRPVLPGFAGSPHAPLLRALLREVLVNVDCGLPLPNFYVYRKPWRRDGAMMGTNRELYRTLSAKYDMDITASGGVSSMDDVIALRDMGLYAAIIGKAYYTGAIDLREAVKACDN